MGVADFRRKGDLTRHHRYCFSLGCVIDPAIVFGQAVKGVCVCVCVCVCDIQREVVQ